MRERYNTLSRFQRGFDKNDIAYKVPMLRNVIVDYFTSFIFDFEKNYVYILYSKDKDGSYTNSLPCNLNLEMFKNTNIEEIESFVLGKEKEFDDIYFNEYAKKIKPII